MFAGEIIFFTCLALIKLSVLAMYKRIFPTKFMKWGCAILGFMTIAWWIAVILYTIFQCKPVHKYWDLETPGKCVNAAVFYISTNGVPNIVMDAMILCLPMYEVYKIHVSRKLKIAIGATFMVGSIVIIASIIKLKVMVDLYKLGHTADVTCKLTNFWDCSLFVLTFCFEDHLANLIMWVDVEPAMGIISACLPTLRPILTLLFRKVGLSQDVSKRGNTPRSLVTFGQGNLRNKISGYSMTVDQDQDSAEHLGGWAEEQYGKRTTTVGIRNDGTELDLIGKQSIIVTTEMAWKESTV